MCGRLEKNSHGLYKNRLTCGRCVCCSAGAILVILMGFGLGLVAYYVPDLLRFEENDGVYFRIKTVTRDDSIIDLRNPDNHEKCSNFAAINDTASGRLMFQCNDGSCVPMYERCSGFFSCPDQSDEMNCKDFCAKGIQYDIRFKCKKQTTPLDAALGPEFPECYPTSYRCDGQVDCPNDEINDESSCPDESVMFQRNGTQVKCSPENRFICADLEYCLSSEMVCNNFEDCEDGSDETACDS